MCGGGGDAGVVVVVVVMWGWLAGAGVPPVHTPPTDNPLLQKEMRSPQLPSQGWTLGVEAVGRL